MKKYIIVLLTIVIMSCDDQLDLNPLSQSGVGNFYKTEADIEQAVVAAAVFDRRVRFLAQVMPLEIPPGPIRQRTSAWSSVFLGSFVKLGDLPQQRRIACLGSAAGEDRVEDNVVLIVE